MTETEANVAETQWAEYYETERILRSLQAIGATEKDLEKEQKSFLKNKSLREAYKSLLTKTANNHKDYHYRKMAHLQIATDLSRVNGYYLHHLKTAAKYELLKYKQSNVRMVEILTAGENNACSECQKRSGTVIDIESALCSMPIPCTSCTHTGLGEKPGFCRCSYVASFENA